MQEKIFTFRKDDLTVNVELLGFPVSTQNRRDCHGSDVSVPSQVMNVFVGTAGIRFAVFLSVMMGWGRACLSVNGLFISILGIGSVLGC